ncbi:Hypothetical protein PHPALM_38210 [Phytophthora palmivora]|uniref:Uncharacterized protein n=1 Tax=Phytophthora palmivora TaxID=4796 RepID=A0A2P4WVH1_9STRA|nr:Hypothetical protein PHPALM_38210 [Phytophthora palmivora]
MAEKDAERRKLVCRKQRAGRKKLVDRGQLTESKKHVARVTGISKAISKKRTWYEKADVVRRFCEEEFIPHARRLDGNTDDDNAKDHNEEEWVEPKRSVSDVEEDEIVYAPLFQRDYTSLPEFERSPKKYMEDTRVKCRNASLKSQIQYVGIPEKGIPLVPQEAGPLQCKYIFTHGWPTRERSSDAQRGRNLGITVKRELYVYNHQIAPENYRHSPGIHQVSTQSPLIPGIAGCRENSNHQVNMTDVCIFAVA